MPNSRHGALIIFGSGPGIGVHVASRFARGGFQKVILLSRNATRLSDDAFMVWSIAPEVEVSTVCVDLTSAVDLQDAFGRIKDVLGETPVECVYYNAARVEPTATAIIRMSWKTEPMKMTKSFCASPMPAQRISSGMKAEAGK